MSDFNALHAMKLAPHCLPPDTKHFLKHLRTIASRG